MDREIKLAPDGTTIGHGNPLDDERARLFNKADDEKELSGDFVEVSDEVIRPADPEAAYQSNDDDVSEILKKMALHRGQYFAR